MNKLLYFFLILFTSLSVHAQIRNFNIYSSPTGAQVYMNGELMGTTPLSFRWNMDFKKFFRYELKIAKEGYDDYVVNYSKDPGADVFINQPLDYKILKLDSPVNAPIAFEKTVISIKEGAEIGTVKGYMKTSSTINWQSTGAFGTIEFNKLAEDLLDKAGYAVAAQTKLFSGSTDIQPALILGADIKAIDVQADITKHAGYTEINCGMTINWQLFSVSKKKVIASFTTTGSYFTPKSTNDMAYNMAGTASFEDALRHLLAKDSFQKAVLTQEKSNYAKKEGNLELTKVKTTDYKDNPEMIRTVKSSVVTVKHEDWIGSGFIINEQGYILTDYHVIEDAKKLEVTFNLGFTLPATVISYDEKADVALIKVDGSGYMPLPIGNPESAEAGEDIFVIGTPTSAQLGQTVTKGILSGIRKIDDQQYLQLDASVNGGNSGGPVLNKNGEVLGLVDWKIKDAEGLGFAIPIDIALQKLGITMK